MLYIRFTFNNLCTFYSKIVLKTEKIQKLMNPLYPIKFKPILKDKIWGGSRLKTIFNKPGASENTGESWEISGYNNDISKVSNGFLEGKSLLELIDIYKGELIGNKVYTKFGAGFPLLIKFIDANDALSVQVHPDDEFALKNHNSNGKSEMWYIIGAEENAEIISGFNQQTDINKFNSALKSGKIEELLNSEKVSPGDVFYIPARTVHAIMTGVLLAEIQQTSDLTYRIYDWNRKDSNGNYRELHTRLASEVIDFTFPQKTRIKYTEELNKSTNLVDCQYFTTNLVKINSVTRKDYSSIDSFIIYICIEGSVEIITKYDKTHMKKGDTFLIPANLKEIELIPLKYSTLLEAYIK